MHQKKTQEAKNAREESSPHEVGLHLSYRIYTQIPQESPIWSEQAEGDGYNQEAVPVVITAQSRTEALLCSRLIGVADSQKRFMQQPFFFAFLSYFMKWTAKPPISSLT